MFFYLSLWPGKEVGPRGVGLVCVVGWIWLWAVFIIKGPFGNLVKHNKDQTCNISENEGPAMPTSKVTIRTKSAKFPYSKDHKI